MATFILTGKYSAESLKEISVGRTAEAVELNGRLMPISTSSPDAWAGRETRP